MDAFHELAREDAFVKESLCLFLQSLNPDDIVAVVAYNDDAQIVLPAQKVSEGYEIAAVIMPSAPRYGLGALARQLGVILTNAHRALDDARATMQVYQQLQKLIEELPVELVAEILRLSKGIGWQGELPFRWALAAMSARGIQRRLSLCRAAMQLRITVLKCNIF